MPLGLRGEPKRLVVACFDPATSGMVERDVVDRVAELERELEKLKALVESLTRPRPR